MPENENGGNGEVPVVDLNTLAAQGTRISAFLLRRIAEAADGRRGEEVYCRARFQPNAEFDFEVEVEKELGPFTAKQDPEFGVFGPFFTAEAKGPNRKDTPIESITITLTGGKVVRVDPRETDSLFWTVSAVEKFLVPYYAGIHSALAASTILSGFDRKGMVCLKHGPETEWTLTKLTDAVDPNGETIAETTPFAELTKLEGEEGKPKLGLQFVSFL